MVMLVMGYVSDGDVCAGDISDGDTVMLIVSSLQAQSVAMVLVTKQA